MAPGPATAAVCDRGDCPAPARHVVMMHGQDFYFCGHHTVELAHAIRSHDATDAPSRTLGADHAALATRLDGLLTVAQPR
ncbi:MAG TPA: hypothetical protein VK923_12830 [Euzebyales bacterium]|nr:hypothetical protein [Euzebyales bacterium]